MYIVQNVPILLRNGVATKAALPFRWNTYPLWSDETDAEFHEKNTSSANRNKLRMSFKYFHNTKFCENTLLGF